MDTDVTPGRLDRVGHRVRPLRVGKNQLIQLPPSTL
jgi:hypothetical protein